MTAGATHFDGEDLGRRELLTKGLIGGGLVAAAFVAPGLTRTARADNGELVSLDVDTHGFADFEETGVGEGPGGAFYVSGDIVGSHTGVFHCWGYTPSGGRAAVVNQEFEVVGRGKILIAGVESDAPRAVTGGTGDFANARGQGVMTTALPDFFDTGAFTIVFELIGITDSQNNQNGDNGQNGN